VLEAPKTGYTGTQSILFLGIVFAAIMFFIQYQKRQGKAVDEKSSGLIA
jgi:LPXTG-motif cell wall-anchored protein